MTAGRPGAAPEHRDPSTDDRIGPTGAATVTGTPDAAPAPLVLGDDLGIAPEVRQDGWAELDPATAAALLRLWAGDDPDAATAPDDVDVAPSTRHVWIPDETGPVAYLRVRPGAADGSDGVVERLCVRSDVRQLGLGSALLADVVARRGGTGLVADVPRDAVSLFARFDFEAGETVLGTGTVEALTRMRRATDTPWREA